MALDQERREMKKVFAMFLTIMLVCIFVMPVSASERSSASDMEISYAALERVTETFPNLDQGRSVRFCDLSTEALSCLEENGIDTDCIGELFCQDAAQDPALVAVSLADNNRIIISTLTGFAQNKDGDYTKVPILTIQDRAWAGTQVSNIYPFTQLTVTAKIYSEYYYISLSEVYYRPYLLEFWYTNNNGYSPSVTNFYAKGSVKGILYTYSGTNFTTNNHFYEWNASRTAAAPSSGIHYTQFQFMPSGYCIDSPYDSSTQGYLYINGNKSSFIINYGWI